MCGRFVVATETSDLVALFDVELAADDLPGTSWNIAPTDTVRLVLEREPKVPVAGAAPVRRLEAARWGLVPPWAKDTRGGATAFNARSETASSKPMFSKALSARRAIVPATGYYEWKTVHGAKTPFFIHPAGSELFAFAALFDWWRNPAEAEDSPERWLLSTTVLTRSATGSLADIHDRMPVFLPRDRIDDWLNPSELQGEHLLTDAVAGAALMEPTVEFYEVDRAVGNVRNNSPELIEPARPAR
jgi:putative SOS response-associated peptidase YedK